MIGQNSAHQPYGGVVPEIAARAHVEILPSLIRQVLDDAKLSIHDVDAIAATAGPGLIGGVMVALLAGKGLALAAGKPLLAVNHLEGHALSPRLADPDLQFPYLLLLVSGGHCQLLEVAGVGDIDASRRRSTTPRGKPSTRPPSCSACPIRADRRLSSLPARAIPRPSRFRARWWDRANRIFPSPASRARSSAQPSRATLRRRISPRASSRRWWTVSSTARDSRLKAACAGVGRRRRGRRQPGDPLRATALASRFDRGFSVPPGWLCTDNAAMIAWAGAERFARGDCDALDAPARARWPLDETADRVRGAGVKA